MPLIRFCEQWFGSCRRMFTCKSFVWMGSSCENSTTAMQHTHREILHWSELDLQQLFREHFIIGFASYSWTHAAAFKCNSATIKSYIPGVLSHSQRPCRLLFTFVPGKLLIISSGKSVCVEDVVVHLALTALEALLLLGVLTCTRLISLITCS